MLLRSALPGAPAGVALASEALISGSGENNTATASTTSKPAMARYGAWILAANWLSSVVLVAASAACT
ncbi:hypothetical protein D3C73_1153100 [compost metagenome]